MRTRYAGTPQREPQPTTIEVKCEQSDECASTTAPSDQAIKNIAARLSAGAARRRCSSMHWPGCDARPVLKKVAGGSHGKPGRSERRVSCLASLLVARFTDLPTGWMDAAALRSTNTRTSCSDCIGVGCFSPRALDTTRHF